MYGPWTVVSSDREDVLCPIELTLRLVSYPLVYVEGVSLWLLFIFRVLVVLVFALLAGVEENERLKRVEELAFGELAFADEVDEHAGSLEILSQPYETQVFVLHMPPTRNSHRSTFCCNRA